MTPISIPKKETGRAKVKRISKTVFIGTPEFAVPTLRKLAESRYKPLLVITQPDKQQGRRMKLQPPPVKESAARLGIRTIQPESIREQEVFSILKEVEPEVIITVAYGGFLNRTILNLPEYGCLNLHPSLLPKYRGATPINHALFNGETITGITIARMILKMDSGPVLSRKEVRIEEEDNYTKLSEKLAIRGADEIVNVLEALERGKIVEQPQNEEEATYCYKLRKEDLFIDWENYAESIHNKVRGLSEDPAATAFFREKQIKILQTALLKEESDLSPGKVSAIIKNKGIVVCCKDRKILLTSVKPAGKRKMTAFEFSIGARIEIGESFISGLSD